MTLLLRVWSLIHYHHFKGENELGDDDGDDDDDDAKKEEGVKERKDGFGFHLIVWICKVSVELPTTPRCLRIGHRCWIRRTVTYSAWGNKSVVGD